MQGVASPTGTAERLSRDPVLGQRVLGYSISALIKAGRKARIYAGHCVRSGRRVALKMLRPILRADHAASEGFAREQAVLGQLSHPGVPRFLASGWFRGVPCYAMERLPGETLATTLTHGPLAPADAARVLWGLCSAVDHLHRAGFAHGALTASAVFASPTFDRVALLDLSHARTLRDIDDVQREIGAVGALVADLADPSNSGLRAIAARCAYANPRRYFAIVDIESDLRALSLGASRSEHARSGAPLASDADDADDEITTVFARAC